MAEIKTTTLSLLADGKTIEIKKPSKLNFEFNKALQDDAQFLKFANDPAAFAKTFDLTIDPSVSGALAGKLQGVKSLGDLQALYRGGDEGSAGATAWAVAVGAYSVATSKIAVAF